MMMIDDVDDRDLMCDDDVDMIVSFESIESVTSLFATSTYVLEVLR
jgi:hypothetical protein